MTITNHLPAPAAPTVDGSDYDLTTGGLACHVLAVRMDRHEAQHIVLALVTQLVDTAAPEITITLTGTLSAGQACAHTPAPPDVRRLG